MSSPLTHKAIVLFSFKPFLLQTTPLLSYLMENDSVYSAAMPQSLHSRLSSTLNHPSPVYKREIVPNYPDSFL